MYFGQGILKRVPDRFPFIAHHSRIEFHACPNYFFLLLFPEKRAAAAIWSLLQLISRALSRITLIMTRQGQS